jgi:O-antigen/teichoic acid export membrane protein
MFDKIKRLGTETAIYGVSTIVGRFLTFFLTPFYANILSREDVGVTATVYAYLAFLNIVYGYGMEGAFMRYSSTLEKGSQKQNFTVPFLSVAATSLVLSAVISFFAAPLAPIAGVPALHISVVSYSAWILFLDALALIPFAALRMAHKAKHFALLKLVNIVVNVGCNILFLLKFNLGLEGIFLSNLIASALTLVLLLASIAKNFTLDWNGSLFSALLRFGLPSVPSYLAAMMIQVIDRPILKALTDEPTVAVYQVNYRLGIFMMLIVSMFDFAWRPFFLSHAKEPDARALFARVLTYVVLLKSAVFLVLSFFLGDIVKWPVFWGHSIVPPPYWCGLSIVPVVLLAYVFLGISNTIVAGIYIEKKTEYLPIVTFVGAGVNVVANFLLIPTMGIMGAAIATLLGYSIMTLVLYFIVQRFYRIDYELARIAKIALAAGIVFGVFAYVRLDSMEFVWKLGLLLVFGSLMYLMKFFTPAELIGVSRIFSRRGSMPSPVDNDSHDIQA